MANELIKKETTELAIGSVGDVMAELGLSTKDLEIPKILLMQSTSEFVGDEKAEFGDMVVSKTARKLGDMKNPLDLIILSSFKTWVVYNVSKKGTPEFMRIEAMTAQNEALPWDDIEDIDGVKCAIRRDQCLNFYVLLASEVKEGEYFPYCVSFKRTGYDAAKTIATAILKLKMFGKKSYEKIVSLSVAKEKNDTNTYVKFIATQTRASTEAEKTAGKMWLDLIKTNNYTVDNSDIVSEKPVAPEVQKTEKAGPVVELY